MPLHDWTVAVTLSGWLFSVRRMFRMLAEAMHERGSAPTSERICMILEGIHAMPGLLIMSFRAYRSEWKQIHEFR